MIRYRKLMIYDYEAFSWRHDHKWIPKNIIFAFSNFFTESFTKKSYLKKFKIEANNMNISKILFEYHKSMFPTILR